MANTITTYDTPGGATWSKPSDCQLVEVICAAGGGGGGGGVAATTASGARSGGGGGAGGGITRSFTIAADIAASMTVGVGGGGNGGGRQTTVPAAGIPGATGGDSAFHDGVTNFARATGGGAGGGGQGGGLTGSPGAAGWGSWYGGNGATATANAAGTIADTPPTQHTYQSFMAPGGSSGGGFSGTDNVSKAGAAGRWSPNVANGLTHPPNPAGGAVSGVITPGIGTGVNALSRSLGGSGSGSANSLATDPPAAVGPSSGRSTGGPGGGAGGTSGGNGGNGCPGIVYVISHGPDVDQRSGSGRGSVAVTGQLTAGRRAAGAGQGSVAVTGRLTGSPRRLGSGQLPVGLTGQLTHRQGRGQLDVTVIGRMTGGELPPGFVSAATVIGTLAGTVRRTGAGRAALTVIGSMVGGRLVVSPGGELVVAVTGELQGQRYVEVGINTRARYLNQHSRAHYHSNPTHADYLLRPTRALYDGPMGERVPWMAGQRKGSIRAALTDANGAIDGLGSAVGVWFTARRLSDGLGEIFAPAVIENAPEAVVRYDPADGDFELPGQYAVQWYVLHSGDLPQYVPDDGYDELDALAPIHAAP